MVGIMCRTPCGLEVCPLNPLPPFLLPEKVLRKRQLSFPSKLNPANRFGARLCYVISRWAGFPAGLANFLCCLCACLLPRRKTSMLALLRMRGK